MFSFSLNSNSQQMIQNILNGLRTVFPAYPHRTYVYDNRAGVHALEIAKNGRICNLYLFYPETDGSGKIGSVALYGDALDTHFRTISSSRNLFGMNVTSIERDFGREEFLDIYVDY